MKWGSIRTDRFFGFHPQLSHPLITMSAPMQTTTPTASMSTSTDWARAKLEELRALTDDEDDMANVKRAEKRHRKQAKAEAEERAHQECEEAARRVREEAERRARAEVEQRARTEAERKAKEEAEKKAREDFAKLQAERQQILEEKACLMAEDKWKVEAERWVEVAAGKQKAGEPAKKRAREEPVAGSSGVQVVNLW